MYVGLLCDVGRLVAMQPPWSIATSMITLPGFIRCRSSLLDEHRRLRAGNQHGADHEVGPRQLLADRVPIAEQAVDVRRHDVVEVAQPIHVDVEDGDVGPEAGGDLGRVRADDAAAEDRDVRRRDARHAGQQNAAALLRPLQELRPFLNAHPPGDFAHRREQRQPALVVGQRFVGDARRAGGQQAVGQLAVGGQVEIGEDDLAFANQRRSRLVCGSFTFTIMSARAKISSGPSINSAPDCT